MSARIGTIPGPQARLRILMILASFQANNRPRSGNVIAREVGSYRAQMHIYLHYLKNQHHAERLPNPIQGNAYLWRATPAGLEVDVSEVARHVQDGGSITDHAGLPMLDARELSRAMGMLPPPALASASRTVMFK